MEMRTPNGNRTYKAGAAILKGQPLKFDGSGDVVPCSAANDAAIGVALDGCKSGDYLPVAILGNFPGTVEVVAGGEVALGAQVAADGTATAAATDVIIGRALRAATAQGDMIEIAHQVGQVK